MGLERGKRYMTRRSLIAVLALLVAAVGSSALAAEDEKRIINGPSKTSFGPLDLVLGQGASAETAFQPDTQTLKIKTLVGESRIVTSAKNLILIENSEGRVEILLPNGRVVVVEPGKSDIVGRAIVDDPGTITIRLSGLGPIAQAGGVMVAQAGGSTAATITVLGEPYQSAFQLQQTTNPSDTIVQNPVSGQ